MKKWHWLLISVVVVVLDQASKYWISQHLIPYQRMAILPILNFTLAYNTGAAFSFLSEAGAWHRWFFASFSIIVCLILLVWLFREQYQKRLQCLSISLILGGAVGNLLDRALHGHVIDFIDVHYKHYHFATFNIADSAICIGAFLLVLDVLLGKEIK